MVWLAALSATTAAPARLAPLPHMGPTPLLHVLFNGPPGMKIAFFQGAAPLREFNTPVTVGLRPGYIYRVRISGFRGRPGLTLFPTLEVRGTLRGPPELPPARYPATFRLSEFDVLHLAEGAMLTKVIYLENPEKAFPEQGRVAEPIELSFPPDRDLLNEARNYGRPVLVVRIGDRDTSVAELQQESVPNTILFPDECSLGLPPCPPQLPWACFQWYDPIIGPRCPEEECLHDGGDAGHPAGFDGEGRLQGVDPEDTVAEYRDGEGRKRIACSNRVCLCVPRFGVLVTELRLEQARLAMVPAINLFEQKQVELEGRFGALRHHQYEQPIETIGRERPSEAEAVVATSVVGRVEGLQAVTAQLRSKDVTGVCIEQPRQVDRPLCLCKTCDHKVAQLGDIVTFTITYSNQGGRPITDVVVSDSLTGRLEYVPGSSKTSRSAVFTTQENESGSLILRWSIAGKLLPGESGTVTFQARVR
ncbi:MAG TPA: DUF11 domain-containing protein [Gemmataceae bacterium]|nr:DUF11 domain-containing protein [Gemmataceae bacterium]